MLAHDMIVQHFIGSLEGYVVAVAIFYPKQSAEVAYPVFPIRAGSRRWAPSRSRAAVGGVGWRRLVPGIKWHPL